MEPESELVCRTLGEIGQRRMSVEVDPVWRIFAAASIAAISRTLPRGAQSPGPRQPDLVSFAAGSKKEQSSSAVSRTTGRSAEVLREGSGIKSTGQRVLVSQSAHILRIPGMSHRKKTPDLIYHRDKQGNAFRLRAATIIGRVFCPYGH